MEILKWLLVIAILIAVLLWLRYSVRVVGPDEIAVLVLFGEPVGFADSGPVYNLCFPLPSCYLTRFSKKVYNLTFPAREVVTREGFYGEPEERQYGAQVLTVRLVMYLHFPRNKRLIKAFTSRVPTEERALMNYFEEVAVGSLRLVLGKMTWREAIEKREEITEETEELIKSSELFTKTGFGKEEMSLVIQDIKLPPRLEGALPKIDIERLEKEAADFEASQVAKETVGTVVKMMAESRGIKPEEVQEKIERSTKMQKEFRELAEDLIVRHMGIRGGSYLDIRVSGVGGNTGNKGFAEQMTNAIIAALAAAQNIPKRKPPTDKKSQSKVEELKEAIRKRKGW